MLTCHVGSRKTSSGSNTGISSPRKLGLRQPQKRFGHSWLLGASKGVKSDKLDEGSVFSEAKV